MHHIITYVLPENPRSPVSSEFNDGTGLTNQEISTWVARTREGADDTRPRVRFNRRFPQMKPFKTNPEAQIR